MKVLLINGSPKANGNTAFALSQMADVFRQQDIDVELIHVGNQPIRGCTACGACHKAGKCVIDDLVNEVAPKFEAADAIVLASPVYYASANSTLTAFLDRLFFSAHFDMRMKVGASV
ncbi:MAG: flavodoxin family protein, partial [Oscillospiraceae bacterium]|nr:flavodoxin family protein [Oscillospiraceae bacterium]